MTRLSAPETLGSYLDIGFMPPIPVMVLRWSPAAEAASRQWVLPGGDTLEGSLPRRFGIRLRRQNEDAYHLALVWDSTYRQWFSLRRKEILGSALEPVLEALGNPLESLLSQPVSDSPRSIPGAA